MVKQLAGMTNEKFQSAYMLVLRHVIEDEDTIRQIMRSEIMASFETRSSRQTDTTGYVRQMYHLVLRAPEVLSRLRTRSSSFNVSTLVNGPSSSA
jgi:E3 ubiquitin-protein ligase HUWE1